MTGRSFFGRASTRRPPGPRPRYPGQHIRSLALDKLGLFADMARQGDVSQIRLGPERVALLMHPEDIRRMLVTEQRRFSKGRALDRTKRLLGEGLLTSEGDFHLRQRRLVSPAFHRERLIGYGATMIDCAASAQAGWQDGETRDVHADMMHLALVIAGRTLFDADVERDASDVGEVLELSLRMFGYALLVGRVYEYAPLAWVRRLRSSRERMDALIYQLIAERRASASDRGDLLSMLVGARDADGDGAGMSDEQLRDEIVTLLMAGHETTANALTWSWYLLSQHPEVEAELHAELGRVLGGRPPAVDDLPNLAYTRAVLAESMRLYPPAWAVERLALEDFEAGGYTIRRGTLVIASQYLVHRDPRWWNEPERFDPARWMPDRQTARPKFAYFPFGGGTRICVGEHFAWMEGTLLLATIAQRWRLRYEASAAPIPEPLVTLRPRGGLRMRLEARSSGVPLD